MAFMQYTSHNVAYMTLDWSYL